MCGKTEQISLVRNKDAVRYRLNSDCCMTILLRQLWEELLPWERTRWHWSKHVKFRPSWQFHKGCLSLHSCQTAILPHWCWHIEHTLPSPPFNQHSFEQWFSLFYEVLSFEKSPWASLGRILALACSTTEKHWCPVSTFACFRGRAFLGIPYSSPCVAKLNKSVGPKQGCCPLQAKFRLLYDNSFAPALGGAFAVGTSTMALIQRCQIQAIMTVPQRLSFSAGLTPPISITDFNIQCHLT